MTQIDRTGILARGMKALQVSIPVSERCPDCEGKGMVYAGCALTASTYDECGSCQGAGRNDKGWWAVKKYKEKRESASGDQKKQP